MIPGMMDLLCSKDALADTFKTNIIALGAQATWYFPTSFSTNDDRMWINQLVHNSSSEVWIVKPNNAAEGHGICLTTGARLLQPGEFSYESLCPYATNNVITRESPGQQNHRATRQRHRRRKQITRPESLVVQEYVIPMTATSQLQGYERVKWDVRVWVLVTSIKPLRIYALRDGLVRMAARTFSTSSEHLNDVCIHLTNGSLQKKCRSQAASVSHAPNSVWDSAFLSHIDPVDDAGAMGGTWSFEDAWAKMLEAIVQSLQLIKHSLLNKTNAFNLNERQIHTFQFLSYDFVLRQADGLPRLMEVNADGYMKGGLQRIPHAKECTQELFSLATASSASTIGVGVGSASDVSEVIRQHCADVQSSACPNSHLVSDVRELSQLGGRCWRRLLLSRAPLLRDEWSPSDLASDSFVEWWMTTKRNTTK
jgi:hypothetical protein